MSIYKDTGFDTVQRDDLVFVPKSSDEYIAWLSEGNTPEPADPTPQPDHSAMRSYAYVSESDPLFFKEQRGEVEAGTWLAKVNEIKARWPQ